MLKLPDFMRIDPNDFNAENIRRMSSYGKPQEDFLTGAVQQFQNSVLFKETYALPFHLRLTPRCPLYVPKLCSTKPHPSFLCRCGENVIKACK